MKNYRYYKLATVLPNEVLDVIDKINGLERIDLNADYANDQLVYITSIVKNIYSNGQPLPVDQFRTFTVKDDKGKDRKKSIANASVCVGSESEAADIIGVRYVSRLTARIVTLKHNVYNLITFPYVRDDLLENFQKWVIATMREYGVRYGEYVYVFNTANNSKLQNGEAYMVLKEVWDRCHVAFDLRCGAWDTGADFLKRRATLWTPSVIAGDENSHPFSLADVCVVSDTEVYRTFKNILRIDPDTGKYTKEEEGEIKQNLFDGFGATFNGLPSGQYRGYWFKGFLADLRKVLSWLIANGELSLDDTIEDINGKKWAIRDIKVLITESVWKGAKVYKKDYAAFVSDIEKIAERWPSVQYLRIVRRAEDDVAEEDADEVADDIRKMSRQANQQWIFAEQDEVNEFVKSSCYHIKGHMNAKYYAKYFAGKNEAVKAIVNAYPGIMAAEQVIGEAEAEYVRALSEAAFGKIRIHGEFPFNIPDPVAFLRIYFCGSDPKMEKGVVEPCTVSNTNYQDGEILYTNRYPSNHLVGAVVTNHRFEMFEDLHHITVFSVMDDLMIKFDGDFDGDKNLVTNNPFIVEQQGRVLNELDVPLIVFKHNKKDVFDPGKDNKILNKDIVACLYNGQKFNKVGIYSNLATKIWASVSNESTPEEIEQAIINAAFAHVLTILTVDAVKTGVIPQALMNKGEELRKQYKKMPWNQSFKLGIKVPYYTVDPDENLPRGNSVADKIAGAIVDRCGDGVFAYDTCGRVFDVKVLMNPDVSGQANGGIVKDERLKAKLVESMYINDDLAVVRAIKKGEKVQPGDLMKFLFKNAAGLEKKLALNPNAKDIKEDYYRYAKELLIALDPEHNTPYVLANHFAKKLFEVGMKDNKFASENMNELQKEAEKGRLVKFGFSVFADEYLENIYRNTDRTNEYLVF